MFTESIFNGTYNGLFKEYNPFNFFYQRTYLFFQQLVDQQIQSIYSTLKQKPYYKNTFVILTSDHGDHLGAHGLSQKWHTAYSEAIDVPLIISHHDLKNKGMEYHEINGHDALLPTFLILAGLNQEELRAKLATTHTEAHPLVGKAIGDKPPPSCIDDEQVQALSRGLFTSSDAPFNGKNNQSILAQMFGLPKFLTRKIEGVRGNTNIEMVQAYLKINGVKRLYKYVSCTPDPSKPWHHPSKSHPQSDCTSKAGALTVVSSPKGCRRLVQTNFKNYLSHQHRSFYRAAPDFEYIP
ncbi:MAG: sulfatase-like hydrolase/transferase [Legionella sp.]